MNAGLNVVRRKAAEFDCTRPARHRGLRPARQHHADRATGAAGVSAASTSPRRGRRVRGRLGRRAGPEDGGPGRGRPRARSGRGRAARAAMANSSTVAAGTWKGSSGTPTRHARHPGRRARGVPDRPGARRAQLRGGRQCHRTGRTRRQGAAAPGPSRRWRWQRQRHTSAGPSRHPRHPLPVPDIRLQHCPWEPGRRCPGDRRDPVRLEPSRGPPAAAGPPSGGHRRRTHREYGRPTDDATVLVVRPVTAAAWHVHELRSRHRDRV